MKGMKDLFHSDLKIRHNIIKAVVEVFEEFNFIEIQTPILEKLDLFIRSVGLDTDIISKEMYVFNNSDGDKICMRPENTAGVIRALIDKNLFHVKQNLKFYYIGSMFRHERPQKGRLREFTQIGAEFLGNATPHADAEFLIMVNDLLSKLSIDRVELVINSLGFPSEREAYFIVLRKYYDSLQNKLCTNCQQRYSKNILRLLDCKNSECCLLADSAPNIYSHLTSESIHHFQMLQEILKGFGIKFRVSHKLVRGLDYYTGTVFEFIPSSDHGRQNAIIGGGRYDKLVSQLGGPNIPAIGMALGLDRIVSLVKKIDYNTKDEKPMLTLVSVGSAGKKKAFDLMIKLRRIGIRVDYAYELVSVKSQMRRADKLNSSEVVVIGDNEIKTGFGIAKSLHSGHVRNVQFDNLYTFNTNFQ